MFHFAKSALLILSLALTPAPLLAGNDGDAIECERSGGSYRGGECIKTSPSSFDLFGKVIVGTLLLIALGVGSGK